MNNAALITLLKKGKKDRLADSESAVWNLFVQILLPLILVLCFVAIFSILTYQKGFWEMSSQNQILVETIEDLTRLDEGKMVDRTHRVILKLQKQLLLKAFEEVKYDEQRTLRLSRFLGDDDVPRVSGDKVKLSGANIDDDDLKLLCTRVKVQVFDELYRDSLYKKVLLNANVTDDGNGNTSLLPHQDGQKRNLPPREHVISDDNRKFILGEIETFIKSLKTDVVTLQTEVLIRIIDALMAETDTLDEESQQLVADILNPQINKTLRKRAVKAFYDLQVTQIKTKLRKEEYAFLDRTWQKLDSINFN